MGAEEFGSIYESLLEMVPSVSLPRREFTFDGPAAGNARKTSASYYTPAPLVDRLVRSALDPLIEKALSQGDPEAALLSLAVLDPACGSGHFSLAAGRRIAEALARVRAGEGDTVTPALYRAAFRDAISHCLYGVDLNPMAVELAKIALWIESVEPGKPLTFLDAHFVCGNSVLGVMDLKTLADGIPAAAYKVLDGDDKNRCDNLKKANASAVKQRKLDTSGGQQLSLFDPGSQEADLSARFAEIDAMPERTVADIAGKRTAHEAFLRDAATGPAATAADLLLAAFLLPKPAAGSPDGEASSLPVCPTSSDLFGVLGFPGFSPPSQDLVAASRAACRSAGVLHWPLVFPAVFAHGGFDCALANPPWDVLQLAEKEFFDSRAPEIAELVGAKRKAAIARLEETNPVVWQEYKAALSSVEHQISFVDESGRFPLSGHGKLNLYALFSETFLQVVQTKGRVGAVVPSGLFMDGTNRQLFAAIIASNRLESVIDFENAASGKKIFASVHPQYRFSLATLGKSNHPDFVCLLGSLHEAEDSRRHFRLTKEDLARISPNTQMAPSFRNLKDAEISAKIYSHIPVLLEEHDKKIVNPWQISFRKGLFNSTTASHLFLDEPTEDSFPLFKGETIHIFDHRAGTFPERGVDCSREPTPEEKENPSFEVSPLKWVGKSDLFNVVDRFYEGFQRPKYLFLWRDIARAVDSRTFIASIVPLAGITDTCALFAAPSKSPKHLACLLADFDSLVHDYLTRMKIGGTHITQDYVKQIATLPPSAYTQEDIDYIVPRVLELTYTSHSLKPWAEDLDYHGEPFRWDENRRAILRAELDARYARLYGLTRDELRYILDPADLLGPDYPSETFRVLKEKELAAFGEYRTQRLVLAAWDRAAAIVRERQSEPRKRRPHYLGPLVMELISATGSDRIALDKLVTAWAALSQPELIAASKGMPEETAAWASVYPDAIQPDERLEATLLNMIDRKEISVERDGTVVRLENEDVADDEIRMDAAIAISYTNLVESMPIPREDGSSAIPAVAVLSSTFLSSMKSGALHREAA